MNTIYYWPDGTWCYKCEYNLPEYGWKSDGYGSIEVSDDALESEIDLIVRELVS